MSENILADSNAKVVYAALQRMSDDRQVTQQAFQHWVSDLFGKPFDVMESVASIEKFLGLSTQERKVLMISMHAASNRAAHELSDVPSYVLGGAEAPASAAPSAGAGNDDAPQASTKTPVIELTQSYFDLTLKGALRSSASGYRELVSIIEDEGLDGANKETNKALKATIANGVDLPKSLSQDDCQNLCHDMYNLVAEIIGPIEADVVSNDAISALLDMPAAGRFNPRDLL